MIWAADSTGSLEVELLVACDVVTVRVTVVGSAETVVAGGVNVVGGAVTVTVVDRTLLVGGVEFAEWVFVTGRRGSDCGVIRENSVGGDDSKPYGLA